MQRSRKVYQEPKLAVTILNITDIVTESISDDKGNQGPLDPLFG